MHSPITSNGRGLVHGRIYKRDGTLAGASNSAFGFAGALLTVPAMLLPSFDLQCFA